MLYNIFIQEKEIGGWMERKDRVINFVIDPEIYQKIKLKTVLDDITIKDYVTQLITKDLNADERITK